MRQMEGGGEHGATELRHNYGVVLPDDRWRLYVTLYASLDPTEGVDQTKVKDFKRNARRAQRHIEHLTEKRKEQLQLPEGVTDGILSRSLPEKRSLALNKHERMTLRISLEKYKLHFRESEDGEPDLEAWASRWWLRKRGRKQREDEGSAAQAEVRDAQDGKKAVEVEGAHHEDDAEHALLEKFVMNAPWMKGLSRDEVDGKNREFRVFKGEDADVAMAE